MAQDVTASEELQYKPGDIIQDFCEPFMKILYNEQKGSHCDWCFTPSTSLRRCAGCGHVHYCNKSCQVADWKLAHKVECRLVWFRKDPEADSSFTQATIDFKLRLLRLFALLKLHPGLTTKEFPLYNGQVRCFNDLMSNQDHVQQNPEFVTLCSEIVSNLLNEGSLGLNPTDATPLLDYFCKLSGIFRTNAFCIYNELKTERIGAGLYIETSIFDHSCQPSAFFVMKGSRIQIRAIGPIATNQKPHISYILAHKGLAERQNFLRRRYNFECRCERCSREMATGEQLDPDRLNQLLESSTAWDENTQWTYVLKVHRELLGSFRKMYWEYDERITNQLSWTWTKLGEIIGNGGGGGIPNTMFEKLKEETRDHLLVTYGEDHPFFQKFENGAT